jgi:carbamoyl-phosphate synthase large subunit
VPTPQTVWLSDYREDPSLIPGSVIAKPNAGSASVGIVRPRSISDLAGLDGENYIVQECVAGIEYTVNLFFDRAGALRCAVPHRRLEVRAGEVSKGRTERHEGLIAAAQRLGASLPGAMGPLCFQAIVRNDGSFAVFEINARFGGGYPLAHEAGATFSQWVLEELTGMPSSASDRWEEGVLMLRYDTAIFHRSPLS